MNELIFDIFTIIGALFVASVFFLTIGVVIAELYARKVANHLRDYDLQQEYDDFIRADKNANE
jgi:hypothetical protein